MLDRLCTIGKMIQWSHPQQLRRRTPSYRQRRLVLTSAATLAANTTSTSWDGRGGHWRRRPSFSIDKDDFIHQTSRTSSSTSVPTNTLDVLQTLVHRLQQSPPLRALRHPQRLRRRKMIILLQVRLLLLFLPHPHRRKRDDWPNLCRNWLVAMRVSQR